MRLLFVIDSFGSGGAQRQMWLVGRELARRGHVVEYFVYHPEERHFWPKHAHVHFVHKTSRWSLTPLYSLWKLVRQKKYSVVLSYLDTPNLYAEISCLGTRTPLVVSERASIPMRGLPYHLRWRKWMHYFADRVVVNSYHHRDRMASEFPWMSKRLMTIVNGIDTLVFAPVNPTTNNARDSLIMLAVGRVDVQKNPLALAKALALMHASGLKIPRICWVGSVEPNAASYAHKSETDAVLEVAGIREYWEWLGPRQDIPTLLADADALIHPSLSEGFSNAICEAMAMGKPVLAGSIADHARLINPGITGFLFKPQVPSDIARVLAEFTETTIVERQNMGRYAAEFARANFSIEHCVDSYETLFMKLSDSKKSKR